MESSTSVKKRVLLIDDEYSFGRICTAVAKKRGIELTVVCHSEVNVGLLGLHQFDAVLVDYDLDGACGVDFIKNLEKQTCDLPTFVISHTEREAPAGEGWPKSVRKFLHKNIGHNAIFDSVEAIWKEADGEISLDLD